MAKLDQERLSSTSSHHKFPSLSDIIQGPRWKTRVTRLTRSSPQHHQDALISKNRSATSDSSAIEPVTPKGVLPAHLRTDNGRPSGTRPFLFRHENADPSTRIGFTTTNMGICSAAPNPSATGRGRWPVHGRARGSRTVDTSQDGCSIRL